MAEGPAATVDLSVIVPTRDRRELLLAKLESLARQTLPFDDFEVIVCDDGSTDGTLEAVEAARYSFPLTMLSTGGARGPGAARNLASRRARGRFLLMSDDDCVLAPGTLEAHLKAHVDHPGSVVVGPLRLPDELRNGRRREPFEQVFTLAGRASWVNATGANTSLSAHSFREAGGYDESLTGYGGEDPDLALRLRARGARFRFAPRALAFHGGRQLRGDYLEKAFDAGKAHWKVYRRHPALTVGLTLGVHPLVLTLKRLLLNDGLAGFLEGPRYGYELAYLRGALEARRREHDHDGGSN
jgi:GT2 family glycosyltransferase